MRRAAASLARAQPAQRRAAEAPGRPPGGRPDLRELKDEHIRLVRDRVFGPQGSMPGDRYFHKKLEGRKLMQWYFPSKYNLQDFRVDEYLEMQADRFAPREPHRSLPALEGMLEKVLKNREPLRRFFGGLDERTFLENPSLQDLYGLLRLVDPDPALSFTPDELVFKEHAPFYGGPSSPFRLTASGPDDWRGAGGGDSAESAVLSDPELCAQLRQLKEELPRSEYLALLPRVSRCRSLEEVRDLLQEHTRHLGAAPPLQHQAFEAEAAEAPGGEEQAFEAEAAAAPPRRGEQAFETEAAAAPGGGEIFEDEAEDEAFEAEAASARGGGEEQASDAEAAAAAGRRGFRLAAFPKRLRPGGSKSDVLKAQEKAEKELERQLAAGPADVRRFLGTRHRFIDPMFRRRRLKWLERQMTDKNKEKEVKFNNYYATHPDKQKEFPTNKGSVTVVWPSPYH